jgi:integrase
VFSRCRGSGTENSRHDRSFYSHFQWAEEFLLAGVRPFVLYSLRHTFLTRLGESGCDVGTLARIAGHSSIVISSRYVHPSENAVLSAMSRLDGHKIGHSVELEDRDTASKLQLSA